MRRLSRIGLALALALAAAACGDDSGDGGDIDAPADIDGPEPDGPPAATFTSFVIDLVLNQTADDTNPRPYADFETLPDPDLDNPTAYDNLFN